MRMSGPLAKLSALEPYFRWRTMRQLTLGDRSPSTVVYAHPSCYTAQGLYCGDSRCVQGTSASEGVFPLLFESEVEDGYDAVLMSVT
jgi:predicted acyl esterase